MRLVIIATALALSAGEALAECGVETSDNCSPPFSERDPPASPEVLASAQCAQPLPHGIASEAVPCLELRNWHYRSITRAGHENYTSDMTKGECEERKRRTPVWGDMIFEALKNIPPGTTFYSPPEHPGDIIQVECYE
jgi:hypothetical protein